MAQISLCGKVQANTEMKATAAKFHEMCSTKTYDAAKASPDKVRSVDLLEGQWGKQGSVICWNYIFNEKPVFAKEIVEIDNKNYSTTFKVIEGGLLEHYKSFKFICQATPKGDHSVLCFTLEYEKVNENVPDPTNMLDLVVSVMKDVDAHLTKA